MTYTKHSSRAMRRRPAPAMGDYVDDILALFFGGPADPSDSVDQTANGTTTSAADFTSAGGVCKPQNFPALGAVREFQNQLNRVAEKKGFKKITVDGSVGPATLTLFKQVQAISGGAVMGDGSSCMGVAPDVDILASQIKPIADALGAPATVSGPTIAAPAIPTVVTKSGKTVVDPAAGGAVGALAGMSSVEKIALLAVAGGVGYLLISGKKRRRA